MSNHSSIQTYNYPVFAVIGDGSRPGQATDGFIQKTIPLTAGRCKLTDQSKNMGSHMSTAKSYSSNPRSDHYYSGLGGEIYVNQRVRVVADFPASGLERQYCKPLQMHYDGTWHKFTELGLRHPTNRGDRMIHVFDLASDSAHYRLELDCERLVWTLICITEGNYAIPH